MPFAIKDCNKPYTAIARQIIPIKIKNITSVGVFCRPTLLSGVDGTREIKNGQSSTFQHK